MVQHLLKLLITGIKARKGTEQNLAPTWPDVSVPSARLSLDDAAAHPALPYGEGSGLPNNIANGVAKTRCRIVDRISWFSQSRQKQSTTGRLIKVSTAPMFSNQGSRGVQVANARYLSISIGNIYGR